MASRRVTVSRDQFRLNQPMITRPGHAGAGHFRFSHLQAGFSLIEGAGDKGRAPYHTDKCREAVKEAGRREGGREVER